MIIYLDYIVVFNIPIIHYFDNMNLMFAVSPNSSGVYCKCFRALCKTHKAAAKSHWVCSFCT